MAYPHVFVDGPGNTASGEEVMDNLDYLLTKITANAEPLGTVKAWYPPSGASAPFTAPTGYAFMDGTAWASIPNDLGYSTGNIPDARGRLILGADPSTAKGTAPAFDASSGAASAGGVGGTVGAAGYDTRHTHNVPGVSHTHNISSDGSHSHGGATGVENSYSLSRAPGSGTAFAYATDNHKHSISSDGSHSHGGGTAASTPGDATAGSNGGDGGDFADVRGPVLGMLPIMKVKNA